MFDKLIDAIANFGEAFLPCTVLNPYQRGVVLRLGTFQREIGPGFHLMIPLIDRAHVDNVVPRTRNMNAQSLITADGKQITISTVVTAEIADVKKALLEVESVDDALIDICYGAIGLRVSKANFEDISKAPFLTELKKDCNKAAEPFGVNILRVGIADLTVTRAIRLIGIEGALAAR